MLRSRPCFKTKSNPSEIGRAKIMNLSLYVKQPDTMEMFVGHVSDDAFQQRTLWTGCVCPDLFSRDKNCNRAGHFVRKRAPLLPLIGHCP